MPGHAPTHTIVGRRSARPRHAIVIAPNALTRPLKTSENVARELVRDIIATGRRPGDALAPEAVMLEQYGVGRESLREALRLLEVQGLIFIRRGAGGGPVVGTVDPANLGRISSLYYHLAGATYRELFEAWAEAEALLAERAAANPRAAVRRRAMAPYITDNGDHPDDHDGPTLDVEGFVQVHTRFHAIVASLAANRVLELSLQVMGQIVSRHAVMTDDPTRLRQVIIGDHRRLARAVTDGDREAARRLMDGHVRGVTGALARGIGAGLDGFIDWR
jgi:DNA-binding FadR family transcriptional regulator